MRMSDCSSDVCSSDLGRCSVALSSLFRRVTMAGGVPPVVSRPYQVVTSAPVMPCSVRVGTSGRAVERLGEVTAKGRVRLSFVEGESVSGRVELGGVRTIYKTTRTTENETERQT